MVAIREFLTAAVKAGASDLHLKPYQKPFLRVHGSLVETEFPPIAPDDIQSLVADLVPPHLANQFQEQHEADFSHGVEGVGRFRVNVFVAQGIPSVAFRHVKTRVPGFEELHLPLTLKDLALSNNGIIILCGTTGCGKSTTMAAMIQHMNTTDRLRIITVEDPIEYLFEDERSLVTQREVGLDTLSFQTALRHVMRQDPDVIVIGEMRDQLSFRTALAAAEMGHLVLTTLHSSTAAIAIHRILQFFPSNEWEQVRLTLASNLRAVICQRLIPATQGGVRPAVEILVNTPTVQKLIEKDKLEVLPAAIETGTEDGMQTFNQAIYKLIKGGSVTQEEGMRYATNPEALRMNLQGIFLDEARRILAT
jgi:twitching motility protein PilT